MESPERAIAMEIPVIEGSPSCSPPSMPSWLRKRLSEPKSPPPSTVEEIEAKLRHADLRRQKFYESLSSKARAKPRSPSRSSSSEDDLGQRLEAKLQAAEEKRLSILTNAQMRLARLDELRLAAKAEAEMRLERQRAELGTKVEMKVQQAEANRMLILRANRQRRAKLKERTSQSLQRRMARESKYKERVQAALCQKRAAAEKKRLSLLEAEKSRAHARAMQVQSVASSVTHNREIERNKMKNNLEDRIQRARRNRAQYLMQRGRQYNTVLSSWNMMHEHADILSRKLARCWRKFTKLRKTTVSLAKIYNELYVNEKTVKAMEFEQLALVIQSPATLSAAKAFLDRLECRYKLSRAFGSAPNSSSWDDIDHLLKRVVSPKRRQTPRKPNSSREVKKSLPVRQASKASTQLSRYQVRVVLCAYMILGHPDAVISGQGERETALAKSAETFIQEFERLIKIILDGPSHDSVQKSDNDLGTRLTFRRQLAAFDSAWCSFLNSFVVWKSKDARSLEEDLVRAACHLELSMMQTCKMTPDGASGPLSYDMKAVQKQVSDDQKLLREKVLHLGGDDGVKRMETAISETRVKFFTARENGGSVSPLSALILSPSPATTSSSTPDKAREVARGTQNQRSVVRSLFTDKANSEEITSSTSSSTNLESSGNSLDLQNVVMVNEYVHGERLEFADNSSSSSDHKSDVMGKVKETMKRAFWDRVIESVNQAEPNYSHVVELIREVRDEICAIAPSWRGEICETIDLEILTQVLKAGELDMGFMGKILEFALNSLQKLSAPVSEDQLKKKHQQFMKELASENSPVVALIEGLRFVLEEIQDLKEEISKARIRMLEPLLNGPDALYYIGKAFTNSYGHPSNASVALPLTAKWLSSAKSGKDEAWNDHKNSLAELLGRRESSSTAFPSTTLRTGGNLFVKGSGSQADASSISKPKTYIETIDPHLACKGEEIDLLIRLGLMKLVCRVAGLTESEIPETMSLNIARLWSVQSQLQKIIVVATSRLILQQTLLIQRIVTSQSQMESILSNSVIEVLKCLDSVADAGISNITETLIMCIEKDNNPLETKLQPVKEFLGRMLTKSLQEGDAIFTRVSQTVYLAARGVVLGGTGKQGRELAEVALQKVGAGSLVDNLVEAMSALVVMAKVSGIVHGPWYANLTMEQ